MKALDDETIIQGMTKLFSEMHKLCYVSETSNIAYFTTQDIMTQWGDDWDDAYWASNAGIPYTYQEHHKEAGRTPWSIYSVMFQADLQLPCEVNGKEYLSVEDINKNKEFPWLSRNNDYEECINIWAGTTLRDFIQTIWSIKGDVYLLIERD